MKAEKDKFDGKTYIVKVVKDLLNHIGSENLVEKILYGQLHIEYLLNAIIENGVFKPRKLSIERMTFSRKIALAVGLGLVDSDIEPALKKLGYIRNKIAHNIGATKADDLGKDLLNLVSQSQLREKVEARKEFSESPYTSAVYVLWFYLFEQYAKVAGRRSKLIEFTNKIVSSDHDDIGSKAPEFFQIVFKEMTGINSDSIKVNFGKKKAE